MDRPALNPVPGFSAEREGWSRRRAVKGLSAVTGAAGLVGLGIKPTFAEPPSETTRIRLVKASLCTAPAYVAEDLLRSEGFSDVQYLDNDPREIGTSKLVATGAADLNIIVTGRSSHLPSGSFSDQVRDLNG